MSKKRKDNILLPDELTPEAEKFIKAIISELRDKERLDKVDNTALYLLANAANLYIQSHQHIKDEGLTFTSDRGNISVSPYVKIARDSEKTILAILGEYGCTLRSRQKLKELDNTVEDSPLAEFIKSAREED